MKHKTGTMRRQAESTGGAARPRPEMPVGRRSAIAVVIGLITVAGPFALTGARPMPDEDTVTDQDPATDAAAQSGAVAGIVYRVPITGTIDRGLAPFVERAVDEAENAGAAAIILDMDTPGGLIAAAQRIVDAVRGTDVPVYTFVNDNAYSAGALISLATDGIYMRPGSVIGAATPVSGSGEKLPEKYVSAMRAKMRALAEAHGLDPRIAEAMVDESIAIPGVIEAGKLLTLTTEEAVDVGYATEVEDWNALFDRLGLTGARVRAMEANWAEQVVRFLTNPIISPLLLTLGMLGLLVEIRTPTFGMAGAAGLAALALFFGSHLIVGLAGWEELILFGGGLALVAVEVFIPGFGIFGIAGALAILASLYLSLIGGFPTVADYGQAGAMLSATLLLVIGVGWLLMRALPANRRLARAGFMLREVTARDTGYVSTPVRPELVGATGVARTDLHPAGSGEFGGEWLDVVAEGGWIASGTAIKIVRSEGYRLVVRPEEQPAS